MRWLVMLSLFAGCKKKVTEPTGPTPPRSLQHPDLQCKSGTIGAGSPPPAGLEIYCARWFPDGTLTKHGPAIEWHTQTRRKSKGQYLDGIMSGAWVRWHPTGSPAEQGSYVYGKKDGLWETFHSNGNPASTGRYVNGKESGDWTYWNDDGTKRTDAHWIDGKRDGKWIVYNPQEQPISEKIYANGRLVSQRMLLLSP